jgi:hypothetical protein
LLLYRFLSYAALKNPPGHGWLHSLPEQNMTDRQLVLAGSVQRKMTSLPKKLHVENGTKTQIQIRNITFFWRKQRNMTFMQDNDRGQRLLCGLGQYERLQGAILATAITMRNRTSRVHTTSIIIWTRTMKRAIIM